jgi:purine-nucleoside phosphorylase
MGIYLRFTRSYFETLAEYNMVKILGADCVEECRLFWSYCGTPHEYRDFGISVITDIGDKESIDTISHDEVLEAAQGT